jgi:MarR family transcriptional regulator, negative regulator of the multidrug operon emrRAB
VNEDDRLENLLGAFALAVADRLRSETEDAIGHTGAAAAALVTIAQYPDRTVEFLRQTLGLSHPAAVRVVDRLVEQRLVRRRTAGRGPALALAPTAAGRRRAREILDLRQEVVANALPDLSRPSRTRSPRSSSVRWGIWRTRRAPRSAGCVTRAAAVGPTVLWFEGRGSSAGPRPTRPRFSHATRPGRGILERHET